MSVATSGGPRIPRTFSATPDAIATYRANTAAMPGSSQRFICSCCGQSHQILGRKLIKADGNQRFYKSAICISKGME